MLDRPPGVAPRRLRARTAVVLGLLAALTAGALALALAVLAPGAPLPPDGRNGDAAPAPPAGLPSGPLLGTTAYREGGEPVATAVARQQERFGGIEILRLFSQARPPAWSQIPGGDDLPLVISFRARPRDVVSGTYDEELRGWFATAPRGRDVYWSFRHEPENEVKAGRFTPREYRQAWQHVAGLADEAGNDRLRATLVLTCFVLTEGSGLDWRELYPGPDVVDVLGWDCYNPEADEGRYPDCAGVLRPAAAAARSVGKPWGVAELGSELADGDDGSGRARWIDGCVTFLRQEGALWGIWFDSPVGGEYRLRDRASELAWREAIRS